MLKPNELFIGAAIWLKSKNKPYEIDDGYDIYKLDEAGELMDAEPIPITPEILTDWCGLTIKRINGLEYETRTSFLTEDGKFGAVMVDSWYGGIVQKEIIPEFNGDPIYIKGEYLHQLQALYQLLTGEVMPINLPKNQ